MSYVVEDIKAALVEKSLTWSQHLVHLIERENLFRRYRHRLNETGQGLRAAIRSQEHIIMNRGSQAAAETVGPAKAMIRRNDNKDKGLQGQPKHLLKNIHAGGAAIDPTGNGKYQDIDEGYPATSGGLGEGDTLFETTTSHNLRFDDDSPSATQQIILSSSMHPRSLQSSKPELGALLDTYEFPAPRLPPLSRRLEIVSILRRDAQVILDMCQMLLDSCELPSKISGEIITLMRRLAAKSHLYPRRLILRDPIVLLDKASVDVGGFSDIYKAIQHKEVVCLKVLRTSKTQAAYMTKVEFQRLSLSRAGPELLKVFAKEAILWSQLSHCNILPFYGLHFFDSHQNSFVSPWAENGNIGAFLKSTRPRPDAVLLANVLIDRSSRAYVTDFGLSNVDDAQILHWATQSSAASRGGTPRYQAPELHQVEPDDEADDSNDVQILGTIHNTPKSDAFALGCLLYEVFTGRVPFFEFPNSLTVVLKVMQGHTPSRPADGSDAWLNNGLTPEIWDIMVCCWKSDPAKRLDVASVLSRLDEIKPVDHRPPPQWPAGTSMRYRNRRGVDPRQRQASLQDLDTILRRVIRRSDNQVMAKL
ncbi:hypothetical protein DXG01_012055 [Tephrocybe rancida]|nr:hypothetical protein DXG01_012055 [Tephrocybe rancida]